SPVYDKERRGIIGVVIAVKKEFYATELVHMSQRIGRLGQITSRTSTQEPRLWQRRPQRAGHLGGLR
ncbi:MAG TPA: hypothetical protein VIX14_13515, partial [Terriglobales bacterium]